MELLVVCLYIVVCSLDFSILEKPVFAACDIDLHEVLIDHAACAEVEVTHLGVAHLAFRKTYGLAACLKCRHRVLFAEAFDIRRSLGVDYIRLILSALAPAVEDHE